VVLPDADIPFAAEAIIGAGYGSAGERCMAISAVVAVGDAGDSLVAELASRARSVKVGPGSVTGTEMGPVVTCAARDRIVGYIDGGVAAGAALVVDGRNPRVPGHENGFFVGPTLFDEVTLDGGLSGRDIRSGADCPPRCLARRRDRLVNRNPMPTVPRCSRARACGTPVPGRRRRGDARYQRADSGSDGVLPSAAGRTRCSATPRARDGWCASTLAEKPSPRAGPTTAALLRFHMPLMG
jgi:hypothetical protein